jgi:short-subunit dehydrogenase
VKEAPYAPTIDHHTHGRFELRIGKGKKWDGKVAVITGASSGIGAATAERLALGGMRLVLVARRHERLTALADRIRAGGGHADVIAADLTVEGRREEVFNLVEDRFGGAEVLVNNAGFGWYGYYTDMEWSTAKEMLQVNIGAVAHLTKLFLQKMKERNAGHIINVGSIAGSIPSQGVALYSATKAFLDAFTTALFRELRDTAVRVSVVRPGPVMTEFFQRAKLQPGGSAVPAERFAITPGVVAERIWGLLQHPRRVATIPWPLGLAPWVEASMGWLMDLIGPLLLRMQTPKA